jgi:hypothetical protein
MTTPHYPPWPRLRALVASVAAVALVGSADACQHAAPPQVAAPPEVSTAQLSTPSPSPVAPRRAASGDTAPEPTISIHAQDTDVRPLLQAIARRGGFSLVFSPSLNRKVTVELNDVPVSVALTSVLQAAGLSLESTTAAAPHATTAPVVFYQLPVNVDSLSVDAIMKRFGVGRTVAEMIVEARTAKP